MILNQEDLTRKKDFANAVITLQGNITFKKILEEVILDYDKVDTEIDSIKDVNEMYRKLGRRQYIKELLTAIEGSRTFIETVEKHNGK